QVQRWLDNGRALQELLHQAAPRYVQALKRERDKASKKAEDRSVPRTAKPQISFADWELLQQGILLEPVLQTIYDFLADHEEMIEAVRRDLERGLKNPGTGRNGLTPQQVLRSLILKRVQNWDFRALC